MITGILEIKPIWNERFSGQNKTKWFHQCIKVDDKIISALIKLTEVGNAICDNTKKNCCHINKETEQENFSKESKRYNLVIYSLLFDNDIIVIIKATLVSSNFH